MNAMRAFGLAEWALLASLAAILAIVIVILVAGDGSAEWDAACVAAGGHVIVDHQTGIGVAPQGGVATTFSSTRFCLNESGGILGIR